MIYITGGLGFIGKNCCRYLYKHKAYEPGETMVIEKGGVMPKLKSKDVVIHLGATTDTTAGWIECLTNNTLYTIKLFHRCQKAKCKFIYASSAAVYGNGGLPLNPYGWSKLLADWYINGRAVGLRFFNVYGEGEEAKGEMQSYIGRLKAGTNTLFSGTVNHKRDYVYVKDVCKVIDFFREHYKTGIYDVGTGVSVPYWKLYWTLERSFNVVTLPKKLKGKLQTCTCANLSKLRQAGYDKSFKSVEWYLRKGI